MKNIIKFTTLVFIFISLYSVSLFAQWEVYIDSDLMFIMKFDKQNESALRSCVNTLSVDDWEPAYNNNLIAIEYYSIMIK